MKQPSSPASSAVNKGKASLIAAAIANDPVDDDEDCDPEGTFGLEKAGRVGVMHRLRHL